MRAAFFDRARSMVVREVPVPMPGPDEVRLRVQYCGICGSDVSLYKTGALAGPDVVLGHEVSATVDLDPAGRLRPGSRVTPFPARGCGTCVFCPDRRAAAEALGAEAAFDNAVHDPVATTLSFDPRGPRVAFECAGVPESLQDVFEVCGPLGVVGILGIPMAPVLLLRMTIKEQRAFSISGPSPDSMRRALDLLRERPEVGDVVTGTVPLEGLGTAMESLAEGRG